LSTEADPASSVEGYNLKQDVGVAEGKTKSYLLSGNYVFGIISEGSEKVKIEEEVYYNNGNNQNNTSQLLLKCYTNISPCRDTGYAARLAQKTSLVDVLFSYFNERYLKVKSSNPRANPNWRRGRQLGFFLAGVTFLFVLGVELSIDFNF
jgi:hypothetical protein